MMNTIQMYDAQADSINVEDIAKNDINRIMLNRMKRNDEDDEYKNYGSKISMMKMKKMMWCMFQRALRIWDGWGTLSVKVRFYMS